jgi:hypothetical protein
MLQKVKKEAAASATMLLHQSPCCYVRQPDVATSNVLSQQKGHHVVATGNINMLLQQAKLQYWKEICNCNPAQQAVAAGIPMLQKTPIAAVIVLLQKVYCCCSRHHAVASDTMPCCRRRHHAFAADTALLKQTPCCSSRKVLLQQATCCCANIVLLLQGIMQHLQQALCCCRWHCAVAVAEDNIQYCCSRHRDVAQQAPCCSYSRHHAVAAGSVLLQQIRCSCSKCRAVATGTLLLDNQNLFR